IFILWADLKTANLESFVKFTFVALANFFEVLFLTEYKKVMIAVPSSIHRIGNPFSISLYCGRI
ncbi:hypothetical protein, partial [Chryseobacterium sp. CH1]|uniref:hypothetical protein n=1 Tax=Chryseobacterium sp. CH1 TaxID=713551 RepID=UPI001E2FB203